DTLGEQPHAVAALRDALGMAEPEEHTRIFADAGPRLRPLLNTLMQRQTDDFIERVFGVISRDSPITTASKPNAASAALVDPLSQRELEVLGLLAAGMSNHQIAEELVVSLDTVKKHVSHILGKLDATSRTQAVARARELAILCLPRPRRRPAPSSASCRCDTSADRTTCEPWNVPCHWCSSTGTSAWSKRIA